MSVPIISVADMRTWEAATWATGQTESEVIRRVGNFLANQIRSLTQNGEAILILAGKGHNGDDARAAKEYLTDRKVQLLEILDPESDLPRVEAALKAQPALIIDGLFGLGLDRPLSAEWQQIIALVNASGLPTLAVDLPSGLNADTGQPYGAAIRADLTVTVGAPKAGLLMEPAWPYTGRVAVATDVGLVPCPLKNELNWILPADFRNFPPRRAQASHKGTYGHVAIVAGSLGFHGAAVLATRGAQRAQPGLTTLYAQQNIYLPVASQLQSAMVQPWTNELKIASQTSCLLVGPGLAIQDLVEAIRRNVQQWWRSLEYPMVVDASALDAVAGGSYSKRFTRVLTPHPGEAARLLHTTTEKVQSNRVAALREISKRHGNCWVVLKGHHTLIGQSEGEIFVNSSGNPQLAQGGSGDLLAGFIAGLIAQPALQNDLGKTLRYAVWQHGAAADQLQATRKNWIIEDLAEMLGDAA